MKTFLLSPLLLLLLFASCSQDDTATQTIVYTLATPVTASIEQVRDSVSVESARPVEASGKIYAYENYIFVNDLNEGVHVIDNTNPDLPIKIQFLKIPGNVDIAVKNNILYADSYSDLVYFDISDAANVQFLGRLENVLPSRYNWPTADVYNVENVNFETDVIVDWVVTTETTTVTVGEGVETNDGGAVTGVGGSLARFTIVEDYLYAVDSFKLNVFDISSLTNPQSVGSQDIGGEIETIFNQGNYLYIGSASGMYIYDITMPAAPQYRSQLQHIEGCDPVVVQGNYAYVTIRGGNACGQQLSQLDVIDVTDKNNPFIVASISMDEPYGLGAYADNLYVSDGRSGVKIFDISVPENIIQRPEFLDVFVYDIIPLEDKLLLIGENILRQYSYEAGGLTLISTFNLD